MSPNAPSPPPSPPLPDPDSNSPSNDDVVVATVEDEHKDADDEETTKEMLDFIRHVPKVELHAHLNGCIRETTLNELAEERSVTLSDHHFATSSTTTTNITTDIEHPSLLYNVRPRSLQDCFDMFAEIPKCVNDLPALKRITLEALQDFAKHHVVYLELRSTPKQLLRKHGGATITRHSIDENTERATKLEYCQVILQTMQAFEQQEQERYQHELIALTRRHQDSRGSASLSSSPRLPMTCRFLVAIDRSQSIEEAMEHVELAKRLRQQQQQQSQHCGADRVVGVDLGGNPTKNHFRDFQPAFVKAREAGLKITLHCAEVPCNDNDNSTQAAYEEAKSILDFGPDRLGHALLLPPSLQTLLTKKQIPVESCPTSNVMTLELAKHRSGSLLEGLRQHPQLQSWLDIEHPISIATDDPGVFDTTATKELLLVQKTFGVSKHRLKQIMLESMNHAFCCETTKQRLLVQMKDRLKLID